MKKLLAAVTVGAFAWVHGPVFAQDNKSEPPKEAVKKAEAEKAKTKKDEKDEKDEPKKEDGKKKVKKGGC